MYRELLSSTKQFLLQQQATYVPCDAEMRRYFESQVQSKKDQRDIKDQKEVCLRPRLLQNTEHQINAERKTENAERHTAISQQLPSLLPEHTKELPQPPVAPALRSAISTLRLPVLRSLFCDLRSSFDDLKAKLKGLGVQIPLVETPVCEEEAEKKSNAWKEKVPQGMVISFFPSDSIQGQVVKNLTRAIHTKLAPAHMIFSPGKEALAELFIYAQAQLLKAVFFATDRALKSKINEFVLPLELEELKEKGEILGNRGQLFDTPLFDLHVSETLSTSKEEKQAVWNALKAVIQ